MPTRPTDPGIPTLTDRADAEPGAQAPPEPRVVPVRKEPVEPKYEPPVLTEIAHTDTLPWEDDIPTLDVVTPAQPAAAAPQAPDIPITTASGPAGLLPELEPQVERAPASSDPQAAVLRAALQAELEQLMQIALEEAILGIRNRMDTELPGIVARVLERVRPG